MGKFRQPWGGNPAHFIEHVAIMSAEYEWCERWCWMGSLAWVRLRLIDGIDWYEQVRGKVDEGIWLVLHQQQENSKQIMLSWPMQHMWMFTPTVSPFLHVHVAMMPWLLAVNSNMPIHQAKLSLAESLIVEVWNVKTEHLDNVYNHSPLNGPQNGSSL